MENILILNKALGQTPLQTICAFKQANPSYQDMPMTYAGRLDPMAEGTLLVLTGEECKKKDAYLALDKTYNATILLGITTDSLDLLGLPSLATQQIRLSDDQINSLTHSLPGTHTLTLPVYASVPVQGKPLHQWTRENKLDQINIPERQMTIKQAAFRKTNTLTAQKLLSEIQNRIALVEGDFRQNAIIKAWETLLQHTDAHFPTLTLELTVTSGTYIRALADMIGKQLDTRACLFSLKRTSVGTYRV